MEDQFQAGRGDEILVGQLSQAKAPRIKYRVRHVCYNDESLPATSDANLGGCLDAC
jgi:hypothetical protein